MQKPVNLVDIVKSFRTNIYLHFSCFDTAENEPEYGYGISLIFVSFIFGPTHRCRCSSAVATSTSNADGYTLSTRCSGMDEIARPLQCPCGTRGRRIRPLRLRHHQKHSRHPEQANLLRLDPLAQRGVVPM